MYKSFEKNNTNKNLALLLIGVSVSQSFAQLEINKYTINSGAANISGGSFQMQSSVGQVDASTTLTGGIYSINGGFWQKANANNNDIIFSNSFENL